MRWVKTKKNKKKVQQFYLNHDSSLKDFFKGESWTKKNKGTCTKKEIKNYRHGTPGFWRMLIFHMTDSDCNI